MIDFTIIVGKKKNEGTLPLGMGVTQQPLPGGYPASLPGQKRTPSEVLVLLLQ